MNVGLFLMGSHGQTYQDVLHQADEAEALGFDRVVLAERHFRHRGLLCPSPFAFAAAIAARTTRVRIGVFGRVLALDHPLHVAEDAATVDVLSGGRFDFGVARASLDEESHRVFESPMAGSESRFDEALDVILTAWTSDSFAHEGRHFSFPPLAVFPRPIQRPHPPVFVVAVSDERLAYAASRGHGAVISAIGPPAKIAAARELYESARGAPANGQLQVNRFVHVARSDAQAREELRGPFTTFIEEYAPDLRAALERSNGGRMPSFDQMVEDFLVVGSPETVTDRLAHLRAETGITSLLVTLNFATLHQAAALRSQDLLGREVAPTLAAGT